MEWEYARADDGNISLTAEIDISEKTEFILSLGFGAKCRRGLASMHTAAS